MQNDTIRRGPSVHFVIDGQLTLCRPGEFPDGFVEIVGPPGVVEIPGHPHRDPGTRLATPSDLIAAGLLAPVQVFPLNNDDLAAMVEVADLSTP